MKKIIPFKKEIKFNTNVAEIISISLDHDLNKEEHSIKGMFVVSGEYKLTEASINTEPFKYELPFTVALDDKYILDKAVIDIDDFYYETINNNALEVNIDVSVEGLEEREIIEEEVREESKEDNMKEKKERCIEAEDILNLDAKDDTYRSYTVYIVREGDTLEQIINKYETTKEILLGYNDLSEIKIGDKIIIPC